MTQQERYDLVILNGRVMDPETQLDAFGSVGIQQGKITAVSRELLAGREVLDATGFVVAPGFIDVHTHGQTTPSMRMQAFDGVTTALELEAGSLPISLAYDVAAREGRPLNYGFAASWALARMSLLEQIQLDGTTLPLWASLGTPHWGQVVPPAQSQHIVRLVEQGLKEGALGIGILLGYAPQANAEEYYLLAKLAAQYRVPTFTHARWINVRDPGSAYAGVAEVLAAAAATGAHMHLCHVSGSLRWQRGQVLAVIEQAQQQGLKITTEMLAYGDGATAIGAAFLAPEALPLLGIEATDLYNLSTHRWISSAQELAHIRQQHPTDLALIHLLNEDKPEDRALLEQALAFPDVAIASDALPLFVNGRLLERDEWPLPENTLAHPRGSGTFSRILRSSVRERQVLSLMEALRRASLVPAQILEEAVPQMKYKGRLQVGADADITIFDPQTVTDRATYENPRLTSVGIHDVLVHGQFVIKQQALVREALPGKPVRGPLR